MNLEFHEKGKLIYTPNISRDSNERSHTLSLSLSFYVRVCFFSFPSLKLRAGVRRSFRRRYGNLYGNIVQIVPVDVIYGRRAR